MARNQTKSRKTKPTPPALIAYHVNERDEKNFWNRIGAAWKHKDGEGLTVQLDSIPVNGGRIVLRSVKDGGDDAADGQGAAEEAADDEGGEDAAEEAADDKGGEDAAEEAAGEEDGEEE